MRVRHVMTKDPMCCVQSDSAQRAAEIMREAGAGVVPIVESQERRRLVGIVTDRDLCMGIVAEGCDPASTPVERCMTLKVVSCRADDNQIRRVAVVDGQGCLQGIVALADVVERGDVKPAESDATLKKVSAPTGEPSRPRGETRRAA
ncbi:MAG TPA: CBS domain-containing protein [Methylomirabilota bacterium]|nr:CBS domain-containing protein [Methylomirabilota bacterium]